MQKPTKPASLGDIEFDAIIERTESLESEVPEYATESGFAVSDNICLKGVTLDVEAVFSNAPVTWKSEHTPSLVRVETMCEKLRKMWRDRSVVTFTAGSDTYENMCIESCSLPRKVETGDSIHIPFTLKQVTITSSEIVNIDIKYARGGTSGKNTGSAQSKSSSADSKSSNSGKKRSVLCSMGVAAGLLKEDK